MSGLIKKIYQKIHIKIQKIDIKINWKKILKSNKINLSYKESRAYLEKINPKPKISNCVIQKKTNLKYKKKLLSIIIPVYNTEVFLEECLNSLFKYEFKYPVEIICINDGSKDNSGAILDKYAIENDNLIVINQKNSGFSGTRNTGIEVSSGEFIMFIDSDDIIVGDAINKLMAKINEYDIVEGGHYFYDKIKFSTRKYNNQEVESGKSLRGQAWGKIYRRECFDNIRFPDNYWYEDTILNFLIYPKFKKAFTIEDIVYGYRYNINGITVKGVKRPKCIDSYWIVEEMVDSLELLGEELNQDVYDKVIQHFGKILYARLYYMEEKIKQSVFVCASHFIETKFSKFETSKDGYWKFIEIALRTRNYELWESSCLLMM